MSLIRISESSDGWIVDYDRERGMYRVSHSEDDIWYEEHWFDAYGDKEVGWVYLVYGNDDEETNWVEGMFDNREQALACAEWLNLTEKNSGWHYYVGNGALSLNKLDYIDKVKKLKSNT